MKTFPLAVAVGLAFLNAASLPAPAQCTPAPAGLVGWWKGEGNANDSVGANNGTLSPSGAGYAAGLAGQGFQFDGTNGFAQIPDSDLLKPANLTIEAWVRLDPNLPAGRGGESIVFKKNTWSAWFEGYSLLKSTVDNGDGTSSDHFEFTVSRYGNQVVLHSHTVAQRGVWYHVAATYDGNQSVLYVNGVAEVSTTPGFPLDYDTTPVYIGTSGTWAPYLSMFGGIIDEVSIYNCALGSNEIAAIYNAGSAGKCAPVPPPVPAIFSFSPASATNGAAVAIVGTNFSATAASNTVYFGAVPATVLAATSNSLTVLVPPGATYAPITVTAGGLTAESTKPFLPTFVGNGTGISATNFAAPLNLPTLYGPAQTAIADIDGDGKPDIIVVDNYNNYLSIFRNISTNGTLTADSFAPRVDLPATGGSYSPFSIAVADVDGDGRLDIIATEYGDNLVSVYHNTCTPGSITPEEFTRTDYPTGTGPQGVIARDLDGDGRPDIVVCNAGDGTISILQNTSLNGSINFAPKVDFAAGGSCQHVAAGDLNGDGRPDLAAVNGDGTLSLFQNLATGPGTITTNSFAPAVDLAIPEGGCAVAVVDVDGDGKPDLAVTAYLPQMFSVFSNAGTSGNLTASSFGPRMDFPMAGRGHTIAAGDLDGDGKPDLVVDTELDSLINIFRNTSVSNSLSLAGQVELATGWNAWGVSVGDLDGDGRPDIVFANTYDNNLQIYQSQVPLYSPPAAPSIVSQPAGQTVVEGGELDLSVTAAGTGPLGYQWAFNGSKLPGATNATLTVGNLHPSQAGNYAVKITSPYGSATSSNAPVTVIKQNILVYTYSGRETNITAGTETAYVYNGQMFFCPGQTNGAFVGWATIAGKKQFWVTPISDYVLAQVTGRWGHVYSLLGRAGTAFDGNGRPHLWSCLHKGLNTRLAIARNATFNFPSTFDFTGVQAYPDLQTGKMVLREAASTYQYSSSATQNANNGGKTLADLVNARTVTLVQQGYQKQ